MDYWSTPFNSFCTKMKFFFKKEIAIRQTARIINNVHKKIVMYVFYKMCHQNNFSAYFPGKQTKNWGNNELWWALDVSLSDSKRLQRLQKILFLSRTRFGHTSIQEKMYIIENLSQSSSSTGNWVHRDNLTPSIGPKSNYFSAE